MLYFCLTPDFIFLRQAYDLVRSLLIVEEAPAPPGVPVPGPMADPRAGPRRYFCHPPLSDDSGPLGFGGPRGPSGSRPYQAPPAGATGQFGGGRGGPRGGPSCGFGVGGNTRVPSVSDPVVPELQPLLASLSIPRVARFHSPVVTPWRYSPYPTRGATSQQGSSSERSRAGTRLGRAPTPYPGKINPQYLFGPRAWRATGTPPPDPGFGTVREVPNVYPRNTEHDRVGVLQPSPFGRPLSGPGLVPSSFPSVSRLPVSAVAFNQQGFRPGIQGRFQGSWQRGPPTVTTGRDVPSNNFQIAGLPQPVQKPASSVQSAAAAPSAGLPGPSGIRHDPWEYPQLSKPASPINVPPKKAAAQEWVRRNTDSVLTLSSADSPDYPRVSPALLAAAVASTSEVSNPFWSPTDLDPPAEKPAAPQSSTENSVMACGESIPDASVDSMDQSSDYQPEGGDPDTPGTSLPHPLRRSQRIRKKKVGVLKDVILLSSTGSNTNNLVFRRRRQGYEAPCPSRSQTSSSSGLPPVNLSSGFSPVTSVLVPASEQRWITGSFPVKSVQYDCTIVDRPLGRPLKGSPLKSGEHLSMYRTDLSLCTSCLANCWELPCDSTECAKLNPLSDVLHTQQIHASEQLHASAHPLERCASCSQELHACNDSSCDYESELLDQSAIQHSEQQPNDYLLTLVLNPTTNVNRRVTRATARIAQNDENCQDEHQEEVQDPGPSQRHQISEERRTESNSRLSSSKQNSSSRQSSPIAVISTDKPTSSSIPLQPKGNPLPFDLARLVQRPKNFSGKTQPNAPSTEVHSWLNKLEMYLKVLRVPNDQWVPMALLFLEPPAFDTIKAQKKLLQCQNQWTGSWTQFANIMLRHFGDPENDFATRTRLYNLTVRDGNVLIYARTFNHLANKITVNPLSDETLISLFMQGLDKQTINEVIIDPSTGVIWKSYGKLHDYVVSKYSCLKYHGQKRSSREEFYPKQKKWKWQKDIPRSSQQLQMRRKPMKKNNRFPNKQRKFKKNFNKRGPHKPSRPTYTGMDIAKMTPGQRLTPQQTEFLKSKNLCFRCFKSDHSIHNCPLKK